MRSLFMDELYPEEMAEVHKYLRARAVPSGLEDLYWIFMPPELLSDEQRKGLKTENPAAGFYVAVETGVDWLRFELLLRGESLENIGAAQANEEQSLYVLRFAHQMAKELNLVSCL